jgi:hypothetical protein
LHPTEAGAGEFGYGGELFQLLMIHKDASGLTGRYGDYVVAPLFQRFHYGEEFFVSDVVVDFRREHLARVEINRIKNSVIVVLREYSGDGKVGSVGLDDTRFRKIVVTEDRSGGEGGFKLFERRLRRRRSKRTVRPF